MTQPVAAHRNNARERDFQSLACGRNARDEPRYFAGMREAEYEFVDDAIDADGATDQRRRRVRWIREDEVFGVKGREVGFTYAATAPY
jgi:hypothetical protein